jgi:heme O synthase-like polyprenyltransferase
MPSLWAKTRTTLEMIKWEHSIFALPFALTAVLLAANGLPSWRTLGWILVAMVSARSAAMAFNRWADADLDVANPRTKSRAIPAGLLTPRFVLGFTVLAVPEARHALVAPRAGAGAGAGAVSCVDCGARLARCADPGFDCGCDAVGGRL